MYLCLHYSHDRSGGVFTVLASDDFQVFKLFESRSLDFIFLLLRESNIPNLSAVPLFQGAYQDFSFPENFTSFLDLSENFNLFTAGAAQSANAAAAGSIHTLAKVTDFPRVVGCVKKEIDEKAGTFSCRCYDQQGNPADVDGRYCLDFLEKRPFDMYNHSVIFERRDLGRNNSRGLN